MKIIVDSKLCVGHGRCYALAPEVFGDDDHGNCVIIADPITPELKRQARLGADNCPEEAIRIDEEE